MSPRIVSNRKKFTKQVANICAALVTLALILGFPVVASATCKSDQQSCSADYGVNEAQFGSGGNLNACSSNYCSRQSLGTPGQEDINKNTLSSSSYSAEIDKKQAKPSLTIAVNDSECPDYHAGGTNLDAGLLDTSDTRFVNANFSVKSYLSSGYIVQTSGQAPTYVSGAVTHTLATPGGTSTKGTEQFGMNLQQNTNPETGSGNVGSAPSQLPDTTFGFGQVAGSGPGSLGYDTAGTYNYRDGDEIAFADSSSGVTCYDATYIFNVGDLTPAGEYIFKESFVATPTF